MMSIEVTVNRKDVDGALRLLRRKISREGIFETLQIIARMPSPVKRFAANARERSPVAQTQALWAKEAGR